jgi:hypothetical protein
VVKLWDSAQEWLNRHELVNAILIAVVFGAIVLLLLSALISAYNSASGYDALKAECLQYETIGDMPSKCLRLFD